VKRLLVVTALVAALGAAAATGAVVVDRVVDVEDGEWARAGTSRIYCEAFYEKQWRRDAFDCGLWKGNVHVANSYSAVIDDLGVEIDKWDSSGRRYRKIAEFGNP
jgi:hypothetical protein